LGMLLYLATQKRVKWCTSTKLREAWNCSCVSRSTSSSLLIVIHLGKEVTVKTKERREVDAVHVLKRRPFMIVPILAVRHAATYWIVWWCNHLILRVLTRKPSLSLLRRDRCWTLDTLSSSGLA
jgi:hypothetical protein